MEDFGGVHLQVDHRGTVRGQRAVGLDSICGGDLTLVGAISVHGENIAGCAGVPSKRDRRLVAATASRNDETDNEQER